MENAAALQMRYTSFRPMKTTGDIKIEFEIPGHMLRRLIDVLGEPPGPGEDKWCGVARIAGPAEG